MQEVSVVIHYQEFSHPGKVYLFSLLINIILSIIPVLEIKAPKKSKKLPQTLSVDQTIKLVNISGDDFISLRDHAILELFYKDRGYKFFG